MPVSIALGRAKESSGDAPGFGRYENGDLPRVREELVVRLDVVRGEESALSWMAVVPAEQRAGRLLELFLHAVPQPRYDDFGFVSINWLAELQRLVDDGVQRAVFGIPVDVADEEAEDRLSRRALEMLLQRDHRFLLEENRIRRAAGGFSAGTRGARCGRRVPQNRPIHRHRLLFGFGPRDASVSRTTRAARSTSRCVTTRSRRGPHGASRTPACASRWDTDSGVSPLRSRSTMTMLDCGSDGRTV